MNTSPISGTQEFLPEKQAIFNEIKSKIEQVYHSHGFQSVETPIIDRTEILFAKAGGDTEKQIYKVVKTSETSDDADEALRFDHTVPLARYIVEHESNLNFPFAVTQIGRNFRGERAQKGRFREFYQCDVDVIGRNNLPIYYDAKVIACFYDAIKSFVTTDVKIRLSNRKFLSGALEVLNVAEKSEEIYSIIDHSEKVPEKKTIAALKEAGLSDDNVVKITTLIHTHGDLRELAKLDFLGIDVFFNKKNTSDMEPAYQSKTDIENEKLIAGLRELTDVMNELVALGMEKSVEVDLRIVRGLDYYTGTVFEGALPKYPELGSIGGGGRYDNLASHYTDQKFPGVGASIGLSRLFYILTENGLIDFAEKKPIDVAIIPILQNDFASDYAARKIAYELAKKLRAEDKTTEVILTDKKLGDKITFATKIAKTGIIFGEDEISSGVFRVKDFSTGKQTEYSVANSPMEEFIESYRNHHSNK